MVSVEYLRELIGRRILVLDGAMGSLLQKELRKRTKAGISLRSAQGGCNGMRPDMHSLALAAEDYGLSQGNLDALNILNPDIVEQVHTSYLRAGADIIETNTFNSNSISQQSYFLTGASGSFSSIEDYVYELNFKGAQAAVKAISLFHSDSSSNFRPLVAGAVGPTGKMLSLGLDAENPHKREMYFDTLANAYRTQVRGLVDGGADLIVVETIFDPINAKCALYAIRQVEREKGIRIPVIVSATANDKAGHLLSGQSLEAFFVSIRNYISSGNVVSFGLNCSFGTEAMGSILGNFANGALSGSSIPVALHIYPNAGLPDELGNYDETPEFTASRIAGLARNGLLNIVGGCCGTTPEHIRAIADAVKDAKPRKVRWMPLRDGVHENCSLQEAVPESDISSGKEQSSDINDLWLSGLSPLLVNRQKNNFINIGERTNVSGSSKFAGLIKERNFEAAAAIARKQIEDGATIIDINVDDPMSDSVQTMGDFVRYMSADPVIAKVPFMFDSSHWNVLVEGLKNCCGRCVVNSISLKEGEGEFLRKARTAFDLGAAVIVMAFDEKGQAVNYERKIEICSRAYRLLVNRLGFAPSDIIFDVNILTIGTGMQEHANYAADFIKAVKWIKGNLPGCKTSGGVSNLSFAFRGNNTIRSAMHCAFLYHAINAGLDMAIVNPSMLQIYENIDAAMLSLIEDLIFNRREDATSALVAFAQEVKEKELAAKSGAAGKEEDKLDAQSNETVSQKIVNALISGSSARISVLMEQAVAEYSSPMTIIQGPLMDGMDKVGSLFNQGKMFLPQVVKSAKVMRDAVQLLQPYISVSGASDSERGSRNGKVLIATVKGDVHDIGKNIVSIVLSCNALDVIDLGVMVEPDAIVERAVAEKADVICLSGLITPSLEQMEIVARMLHDNISRIKQVCGKAIPVLVGGATTSAVHTAMKLDTVYEGGVFYNSDASSAAAMARRIMLNPDYVSELRESQRRTRENFERKNRAGEPKHSFAQLMEKAPSSGTLRNHCSLTGALEKNISLAGLQNHIDWAELLHFWGFKGTLEQMLSSEKGKEANELLAQARAELERCTSDGSIQVDLMLDFFSGKQIDEKSGAESVRYMPEVPADKSVGFMVATAYDKSVSDNTDHKSFEYLLRASLCARLVEAAAVAATVKLEQDCEFKWLRVAVGYPMIPDHNVKRDIFSILNAPANLPVRLTSTAAIIPDTSICAVMVPVQA